MKYVTSVEIDALKDQYEVIQTKINQAISENNKDRAKELHKQRMKLEVGYKTSDYKSEDELRIVYYAGDQSNIVPSLLTCSAESGRLRAYVTSKVKVGIGQSLSGLYVTIGPRVPKHEVGHWEIMADWMVRQLGLSGRRSTCQSRLTYIG